MATRYRDKSNNSVYEEPRHQFERETITPRKRIGVICNAPLVKLRERASTDSIVEVLALLKKGTNVDILDNGIETNNFKHVKLRDKNLEGYISSYFCEEVS